MSYSDLAPNATNSYSFNGFDVSEPYDLLVGGEGVWTLSYNIWSDVGYDTNQSNSSRVSTWSEVILELPDELRQRDDFEIDGSWSFCARYIYAPSLTVGEDGVNSNCEDAVPDDCRTALLSIAETSGAIGVCQLSSRLPEACDGFLSEPSFYSIDVRMNETLSGLSLEEDGRIGVGGFSIYPHERGNFTFYDDYIRRYYIALFGFGLTNENDEDGIPPVSSTGEMRCLSASPEDDSRSFEEGAATNTRASPALAFGVAALLLSALML